MKKKVFKAEFGRRVFKFVDSVLYFNSTGRVGNLLPHLFQLISYVVYKGEDSLFKDVDVNLTDLDVLCKYKSLIEVSLSLSRLSKYTSKMVDYKVIDDDDELPF